MSKLKWNIIKEEQDLERVRTMSADRPQVIYKHSTRCFVSSMVRQELERSETPAHLDFHFLDLIAHRAISNRIAMEFGVSHESPQVLVIHNGACIYDESHNNISMDELATVGR